jgi:hypothetical protein
LREVEGLGVLREVEGLRADVERFEALLPAGFRARDDDVREVFLG